MKIALPTEVNFIINSLEEAGFEAYAVGGCIRDSMLGRMPNDWDVTTSARPEDVKRIFKRTFDTGIEHGTVTVRVNHQSYEVTTYRIDGEYKDARHPDSVIFSDNLKMDLLRRDFTINAMAYNDSSGLVDPFDGESDLERKIIRCVGNPMDRFGEDALRILRAIRFSAQLGFEIDELTRSACKELSNNLSKISAERICTELLKLIISNHPERMRDLYELGISKVILPEWDAMMETAQNTKHHIASVGEHTIMVMQGVSPDRELRLAALLHDVAKPASKTTDEKGIDHFHGHPSVGENKSKDIMQRLKLDNATINIVCKLVRYHDERPDSTKRSIRRTVARTGEDVYPKLFELKRADIMGQSEYKRDKKLAMIDDFERLYKEIKRDKECVNIKDLAVNGKDIIGLGVPAGPQIGEILKGLLDIVIEDPSMNSREALLDKAKDLSSKDNI